MRIVLLCSLAFVMAVEKFLQNSVFLMPSVITCETSFSVEFVQIILCNSFPASCRLGLLEFCSIVVSFWPVVDVITLVFSSLSLAPSGNPNCLKWWTKKAVSLT